MTTPNVTSSRLNDVMKVCVQLHKDILRLDAELNASNQTVLELTSRVEKLETDKDDKEKQLYQQVKQLEEKVTTQNQTIQGLTCKIERLEKDKRSPDPKSAFINASKKRKLAPIACQYSPPTLTPLDDEYEDDEETRHGLCENENLKSVTKEIIQSRRIIKDTNTVDE
eukprot:CAMPEP_0204828328 /NCGR_PEP_ID=MMETSP1346-20131115/6033_1 /ASSEMBLY_ACC=CAM_ASM_000771 /TAXON_ID=215587 /ORGANISM="Aplanochytrium stocchinoi, Strain GSBS06" /LENGTH=167 /DNA_ID=CAMNT_0051957307 /DNA_START=42 /DNA_END=545 /DNA_ORIENTATION=+